jgi:hypothetical protein
MADFITILVTSTSVFFPVCRPYLSVVVQSTGKLCFWINRVFLVLEENQFPHKEWIKDTIPPCPDNFQSMSLSSLRMCLLLQTLNFLSAIKAVPG